MTLKNLKYSTSFLMITFLSWSPHVKAMNLDIDTSIASQNFRPRGVIAPKVLMLHCVGLPDEWVFKNYVFPADRNLPDEKRGLGVSAHYYIPQGGKIYQLVAEENVAYHAGESNWRSLGSLNDISVGIEFQSLGYAQVGGQAYYPYSFATYSEEQIQSGIALSQQIMRTHNISPENVVWHSDVSPIRNSGLGKTDPGIFFDGKRFAQSGVGVWPQSDRVEDSQLSLSLEDIQAGLINWGYPSIEKTGHFDDATKYVLGAHCMHYLPQEINLDDFKEQKSGSIFDKIADWSEFPYDKATLALSLENLNNKHFIPVVD